MRIQVQWENQAKGCDEGWAVPSARELAEAKRRKCDVMEVCTPPNGWEYTDDEDATDDAGNPGHYVRRKQRVIT